MILPGSIGSRQKDLIPDGDGTLSCRLDAASLAVPGVSIILPCQGAQILGDQPWPVHTQNGARRKEQGVFGIVRIVRNAEISRAKRMVTCTGVLAPCGAGHMHQKLIRLTD